MASDIASFLLWYLQGNEAQLASPANVILIHQKLLEFCQLEGGAGAGGRRALKLAFFVTAVRGQPIHADVFHRPVRFYWQHLAETRSSALLKGSVNSAATCVLCRATDS